MLASMLAAQASAEKHDGPGDGGRGDIVFFASAEVKAFRSDDPADDSNDLNVAGDVLGSWSAGKFRALGELLLSTEEQELERLQVGWQVRPEVFLWLGRFHQPASAWNAEYHHGQYLQPSITRPSIEEWEDDGGILPQHLEGLLLEARLPLGKGRGMSLAAAAGVGPVLTAGRLGPLEIFKPRSVDRRPAFSLRAVFLPDFADEDGIGVLASHSEIGLEEASYFGPANHVDLGVVGLFVTWGRAPWQFASTLYAVRAEFDGQAGGSDDFLAGYAQLRWQPGSRFSVLGRYEGSADTGQSAYLALFPDFVRERAVLDLRWDFAGRNAISVEFASSKARPSDYRELRVQWSAAFR